jgi:hypothetical protein
MHDIHISKCTIKHKAAEEVLQFSVHIFLDDLEATLADMGYTDLALCSEKEDVDAEFYIEAYINEMLIIKSADGPYKMSWVGKEVSEDLVAVWCYLEVENVSSTTDLSIDNNILQELYDDQKNIVTFTSDNGEKEFLYFAKGDEAVFIKND